MAELHATWQRTYDGIVASCATRHPADRASAIQHAARSAGLPATYTEHVYGNISRQGGVNWYTHDELVRGKRK